MNVEWFAAQSKARIDLARYQHPFMRTSTNHYALFASTVYLPQRVLNEAEWEELGSRPMHRLATQEQAHGCNWGELTANGPPTGYNYVTMTCVALYYELSLETGHWKRCAVPPIFTNISPGLTESRWRRSTAATGTGTSIPGEASAFLTGQTVGG